MANGQERVADTGGQRKGQKKKDSNRKKRKQSKPQAKPIAPVIAPLEKKVAKEPAPVFVPRINEPNPPCVICGKPIDAISQSIGGPQPETFSHFDCVLRKIADDERIPPTQKVSYIGRGTFAIIEVQADGKFTIVKRIPYENPETYSFMKKYVENQKN